MQSSRRPHFGSLVLIVWAIAVLALLVSAWLDRHATGDAPYDGAAFVERLREGVEARG